MRRNLQPEWMDQPGLQQQLHEQALRGLARINRFSGSASLLWPSICRLAERAGLSTVRVLDVASGGGDVAIGLWQRAAASGLKLDITGLDVSSTAVQHARETARKASACVHFEQGDVFSDLPRREFDVVMCSLFLHHLTCADAVRLLRVMSAAAGRLLLVNDLQRSLRGYVLAKIACHALTRSKVVHMDGPRSVAGAFSIPEVMALCDEVPLIGARVVSRWPCRFLLSWTVNDAI